MLDKGLKAVLKGMRKSTIRELTFDDERHYQHQDGGAPDIEYHVDCMAVRAIGAAGRGQAARGDQLHVSSQAARSVQKDAVPSAVQEQVICSVLSVRGQLCPLWPPTLTIYRDQSNECSLLPSCSTVASTKQFPGI